MIGERPPLYEFVADSLAAEAHSAIRTAVLRALAEFDQRAKQIIAFHNRSIAQRRRYWRLRVLLEKS